MEKVAALEVDCARLAAEIAQMRCRIDRIKARMPGFITIQIASDLHLEHLYDNDNDDQGAGPPPKCVHDFLTPCAPVLALVGDIGCTHFQYVLVITPSLPLL